MKLTVGQQAELDRKRAWLDKEEAQYRKGMKLLKDAESLKGILDGLKSQLDILLSYDPDTQPPHSAVYVVASVKERMVGLFQDLDFIEEYEDKKADYVDTVKAFALDEDDDATETTG